MTFRHVRPIDVFPSRNGRPLLVVPLTPEELTARYGVPFEEDFDDLDNYRATAIELDGGHRALFIKYRGETSPGTTVWMDESIDRRQALHQLLEVLNLDERDLLWQEGTDLES